MRTILAALATSTLLALPVAAQSVLSEGPVVVTTHGLFKPNPNSSSPLVFASAATIAGTSTLSNPAIEWELGTDSFLVTSGPGLYRVTVLATGGGGGQVTVTNLTPNSAQPLNLFDLDLHPGTGELFLLDQTQDMVLRYAPPFAPGMLPVDAIPVPSSTRAIAVDARSHPNALDVAEADQVTRIPLDGSPSIPVSYVAFAGGLDHDVEVGGVQGTLMVAAGTNEVFRATGTPNLAFYLNIAFGCFPIAMAPVDVEWNSLDNRAYVLAEDGLNPACSLIATGGNHVVRLPNAQGPALPSLATHAAGSGITGVKGDLAIVTADFAYIAAYGDPCVPFASGGPVLDIVEGAITTSSSSFTLTIAQGPPNRLAALMIGGQSLQTLLPTGCTLLVSQDFLEIIGVTDGQGALSLTVPLPPLLLGTDLFMQALVDSPTGVALSEALAVHVGL